MLTINVSRRAVAPLSHRLQRVRVTTEADRTSTITNNSLALKVRTALDQAGYALSHRVIVIVDGSKVSLSGTVNTYYLKQIAQEIVLNVDGVDHLANDLRVSHDLKMDQ